MHKVHWWRTGVIATVGVNTVQEKVLKLYPACTYVYMVQDRLYELSPNLYINFNLF